MHEGELIDPPAGEYQIVHRADGLPPGGEEVAATLYVHDRSSQELSDLQPDPQLLQELATVSGGRVFTPADASELPELFREVSTEVSIRDEIRLWDHWMILVLALSLMMTEWVLRKLHGLP